MKISRKGSFWYTVVLAVFTLVFILVSFSYSDEARIVPILVGISTLILCIVVLLAERYPRLISGFDVSATDFVSTDPEVAARFKTGGDGGNDSAKGVAGSYAWYVGLFIFIFLVGFLISIPVFTFLYLKIPWRIGWLKSLAISVVMVGIIYGGFEVLLGADLFQGILLGGIIPPI